jgi:type II secretory pathway pseudopilin PulG
MTNIRPRFSISPSRRANKARSAFTLLEMLLALSLIVLAIALIGGLMQIFTTNFERRGDDIRRAQLAKSLLNMIADDIRAVVLEQPYDESVLQQMLGGGGGQNATASGGDAGAEDDMALGDTGSTGLADSSTSTDLGTGELELTEATSLPPGIYGTATELMIDVSRVPRTDEYIPEQQSILQNSLVDVPGDMKTVTYYIQTPTNQGIDDTLSVFAAPVAPTDGLASNAATSAPGGLVRRQLDRAVLAYAEETGNVTSMFQTGDLVAPEVVSLEFSYFDGAQWLQQWSSQDQSLPWLVQVSLAMQSASGAAKSKVEPGVLLNSLSASDRQAYGIEVYQIVVAIPGAQLKAADAASANEAAGMEAMGL